MAEKYVPIFFDWIEATQELNDQEKGRLIDAVVLYARGGDWQDRIKGNERYAFPMFRLQVDRAKQLSTTRADARKNKPEQTGTNVNKPEQNEQTASKPLTNTNTNTNTRTNTNTKKKGESAARFTPPTAEQVSAYCREKGYGPEIVDPERFVDFYASKGWKVGSQPMRDWQAAVRNWASRHRAERTPARDNPALHYQQRQYTPQQDEDIFLDLEAEFQEG